MRFKKVEFYLMGT